MADSARDRPRGGDGRALLSRRALFALTAAFAVSGCGDNPPTVRLGAARVGGLFYEIAELLAAAAAEAGTVRIEPVVTAGSQMNLDLLARGEIDIALSLADAAHARATDALAIGRLYEAYLYLAVRPDGPIQRVEDLRGMRVDLGVAGSGATLTAERMLRTASLDPAFDMTISNRELSDAAPMLYAGEVDAILWGGGVPTPGADIPGRMRLIGTDDLAAAMTERYGYAYDRMIIPENAYPGSPAVGTVGVPNLLLASPRLAHSAVSAITELLLRYADRVVPEQALGIHFLDRRWLVGTGNIPMHPAAMTVLRDWHG